MTSQRRLFTNRDNGSRRENCGESSYLTLCCYYLMLFSCLLLHIYLLMYQSKFMKQIKSAVCSYCYNITNVYMGKVCDADAFVFPVFKDHDNNYWLDADGSVPFPENSVVYRRSTDFPGRYFADQELTVEWALEWLPR